MKIHFTKEEYRVLLDILYLSDWVMHSYNDSPTSPHLDYDQMRDKLLSFYKAMDAEDIIEYEKRTDSYFESKEYEEYINQKFIDPYENEVFWDELINRLAKRDLIAEVGLDEYESMEGMERVKRLEKLEETYMNEFEKNGLQNLEVDLGEDCHQEVSDYQH